MAAPKQTLAAQVKSWRGDLSVPKAARLLDMSPRTLEGIEQGRPFRYEQMLILAMAATPIETIEGKK